MRRSSGIVERKQRASLVRGWVSERYLDGRERQALRDRFLAAKPFPHLAMTGFLKREKLASLKRSAKKLELSKKEADLFSFSQSAELSTIDDKTIHEFMELLQSAEFNSLISSITDTRITAGKVDASAFTYQDTDHLLCHDDGISSRRVAYILNLSTLSARDGGALALLSANARGEPVRIAKRIIPKENTFIIFRVTPRSHHQVEEVIGTQRITVTGWFHE